jgi:hypothetical protein
LLYSPAAIGLDIGVRLLAALLVVVLAPPAVMEKSEISGFVPPLSTRGRYIVDATGERFKLKSGNWHGASGTWTGDGDPADNANHHAGENANRIPMGLDRAPLAEIAASFAAIGLNSVRLPFSDEMLHDPQPVTDAAVAANPQLRGLTPLQVYDRVVDGLTGAGLAVILNNHTNTTRWCCGVDGNERWNASQTTAEWEENWLAMARRYRDNPRRNAARTAGRSFTGIFPGGRAARRTAATGAPRPGDGSSPPGGPASSTRRHAGRCSAPTTAISSSVTCQTGIPGREKRPARTGNASPAWHTPETAGSAPTSAAPRAATIRRSPTSGSSPPTGPAATPSWNARPARH